MNLRIICKACSSNRGSCPLAAAQSRVRRDHDCLADAGGGAHGVDALGREQLRQDTPCRSRNLSGSVSSRSNGFCRLAERGAIDARYHETQRFVTIEGNERKRQAADGVLG